MANLPSILPVFLRFVLVGGATALLYFSVFWLTFTVGGWASLPAISLSYSISTLFHFFANQAFTFGVRFSPRSILRYAVLWLINYLVTVVIVYACETLLGLSPYFGVCFAVGVTTLISFNVARHWVYNG